MNFTPLHRSLGLPPSPLTNEILDAAVDAGVFETDDLDWKSELPPVKNLSQGDVPKDIAAMANSGGGIIVYGVEEREKAATGRRDTGELSEIHERAYRSAAVTAISPPVFGLGVLRLGTDLRAVAIVVPASVDGPHLIYRNDFFGAPIRNDADTAWMKERQIEAMYRARFDERRRSTEATDSLFAEAANGRDTDTRAWMVAVAHPRIPGVLARPSRDDARRILRDAEAITLSFAESNGVHPLAHVERSNPRPGLRRWVAPYAPNGDATDWREAWVNVHHDGSVTLAAAVGGHRKTAFESFDGWEVESRAIESGVADFMALVRATAGALHHDEYDVRVAVDWSGDQPLTILTTDQLGSPFHEASSALRAFTPVRATVNAAGSDADFHRQVHQLAEDCVNQGGITGLNVIYSPPEDDD